ncbi:MAG: glycosyltransferase family 39 protein [Candidatus Omnitrophica bacterium]|nr:glycosyltransferase family 39 protein [Candidatus Omnitrophota bacterium]
MILDSLQLLVFMDELSFLRSLSGFVKNKSIIPMYTRYPSLYTYIISIPVYAAYSIFYFIKGFPVDGLKDLILLKFIFSENLILWARASRFITMIFSAATTLLILKEANKKYGFVALLIAASMLTLYPFGAYLDLSRYGLPDMPMTFFVTLSMLLCFSYIDKRQIKYLYWASFISGLAMSTKFNAIMMFFPLSITPLLCGKKEQPLYKYYVKIILLVIFGFFLGSPAFLISLKSYIAGFSAEADILFKSSHIGAHGTNWIWLLDLLWSETPIISSLIILSIIYCAFKRTKEDILFLALLVPSFLIMGALQKKSIWYFVFLYPLISLYAGRLMKDILERIKTPYLNKLLCTVLVVVFTIPAWHLYKRLSKTILPNNRVVAKNWIHENIPSKASIIVDWAFTPELYDEKYIGERIREIESSGSKFSKMIKEHYLKNPVYDTTSLKDLDYNVNNLTNVNAKYLIISSGCYEKFFPSKKRLLPKENHPTYKEFMKRREFYSSLFNNRTPFRPVEVFSSGSGFIIKIYERI